MDSTERLPAPGTATEVGLAGRAHAVHGSPGPDVRPLAAPRFLDAHGDLFRRLTAGWTPILIPAVAAEAARGPG